MIKQNLLNLIAKDISQCEKCKLCKGSGLKVPGEGNPNAKIIFCGEGSGQTEAETGRPFVGRAGKLLDKMIENMGLKREDVFISNIVHCRPPDNRKPEPDEIESCLPYIKMQIQVIQPICVVALGATAMEALVGPGEGITKRHGQRFITRIDNGASEDWVSVFPVYHPSYLLRNPSAKTDAAKDLSTVLAFIKEYESF
jgi:DNA polymerase